MHLITIMSHYYSRLSIIPSFALLQWVLTGNPSCKHEISLDMGGTRVPLWQSTSISLLLKIRVKVDVCSGLPKENTAVNPVRTEKWIHPAVRQIITHPLDSHSEIKDRGMASAWIDLEARAPSGEWSTQKRLNKGEVGQGRRTKAKTWGPASQSGTVDSEAQGGFWWSNQYRNEEDAGESVWTFNRLCDTKALKLCE